jgi:hypothetical protein
VPSSQRSSQPRISVSTSHSLLAQTSTDTKNSPRSGKNIGLFQLITALRQVYHLSLPVAAVMSFVGIFVCGHGFSLDLDGLAAHNKLEHDASLVHLDAPEGCSKAPTTVDPDLLRSFLSTATPDHGLSEDDFARTRCAREEKKPLGALLADFAKGEAALTLLLMANENGEVPVETLERWWGEERLPDGWQRPHSPITFAKIRRQTHSMKQRMVAIRDQSQPPFVAVDTLVDTST